MQIMVVTPEDLVKLALGLALSIAIVLLALGAAKRIARGKGYFRLKLMRSLIDVESEEAKTGK